MDDLDPHNMIHTIRYKTPSLQCRASAAEWDREWGTHRKGVRGVTGDDVVEVIVLPAR